MIEIKEIKSKNSNKFFFPNLFVSISGISLTIHTGEPTPVR